MAASTTLRAYIDPDLVSGETDAQIALAEELIDAYVGYQERHITRVTYGKVTAYDATAKTVADTGSTSNLEQTDDYFNRCVLEVIDGTGAGQIKRITGSSRSGKSVTLQSAFTTALDTTSVFKIYQLAKFPRRKDVYGGVTGDNFAKSIPQAVQDAVVAQTEFIIAQGDAFFSGISSDMESERILNYSYTRGQSSATTSALVKMIAPKARIFLRGIKNSTGRLTTGPDTWQ